MRSRRAIAQWRCLARRVEGSILQSDGAWQRRARGEQNRKNPHIAHKSAPPRKSTHPHFRTIFERSSSRNIATRYGFPTYVNFVGQKTGVRALEQGECGALGALHHEAFDFFFGGRFFSIEKMGSAPKRHLYTALGHEPGRFGPQESPPLWNAIPINEIYR